MEPPAQPRTQVGAGRNARGGWFRPCHAGRQTGARWVGARSLGVGGRSKNSGGPGGENGGGRPKSAGLPRLPQRVGAHAADTLAHRHSTPTAHTTQQTPDTHTPQASVSLSFWDVRPHCSCPVCKYLRSPPVVPESSSPSLPPAQAEPSASRKLLSAGLLQGGPSPPALSLLAFPPTRVPQPHPVGPDTHVDLVESPFPTSEPKPQDVHRQDLSTGPA